MRARRARRACVRGVRGVHARACMRARACVHAGARGGGTCAPHCALITCAVCPGDFVLFETLKLPNLYVCPVENVLGRVPMILCFLRGNTNNTIQYSLQYKVPDGAAADSRHDSGTGSRLFEVNVWMWNYGRAFPRKIPVADAEAMRRKRVQDSRLRGAETLKRRREAGAVRPAE